MTAYNFQKFVMFSALLFVVSVTLISIEPAFALNLASAVKLNSCAEGCPPNMGVDKNGKTFFSDGLRINGKPIKMTNQLHVEPSSTLTLPVGKRANFIIKAQDTDPEQIEQCSLAIGIPKGDFVMNDATFRIDVKRNFDGSISSENFGDSNAFQNVTTNFEIVGTQFARCTISFIPTEHLQYDMFAVSVTDKYKDTDTHYVNNGIIFRGKSIVDAPSYNVLDDRGLPATITITDKTLENLTVAKDQKGNTWHLKDGQWYKDFVMPDMSCVKTSQGYSRYCPEFQKLLLDEQKFASKTFDSSKIKGIEPKFYFIEPTHYPRMHDPLPNMNKALVKLVMKQGINHSSYKFDEL